MRFRLDGLPDAVLQFRYLASLWRWLGSGVRRARQASTLVPIGTITPELVRRHHGAPLRFVGDPSDLLDWLVGWYGRTLLARQAPKNAFVAQWTDAELREGGLWSELSPDAAAERGLVPGDRIFVALAPGESVSHLNSVLRRQASRRMVRLAFVDEIPGENLYTEYGLSVWVRERCVEEPFEEHGRPFSIVKLEVVAPDTPDGEACEDVLCRDVVNEQAVIFNTAPDPTWLEKPSRTGLQWAPYRYMAAFGSRLATGAAMAVVRLVLFAVLFGGYGAALWFWPGGAGTSLGWQIVLSLPILVPPGFKLPVIVWTKRQVKPPCIRMWIGYIGLLPHRAAYWREWHGSSRRCLAIGDRERFRSLWQRVRFNHEDAVRCELRQIKRFFTKPTGPGTSDT